MNLSETAKMLLVCSFSILSLFLGFFANYWRISDQRWFDTHQLDMESYIIGRMVKSRQDGILSSGGLTGIGSLNATPMKYGDKTTVSTQYLAYINNLPFGAYSTYNSQIGGQGILFSILDKLITALPQQKLRFFHALTSLLSAIILTGIILWFYLEFGLTVSLFVLFSSVFSQWLVVFGRNLWWSMWAFYLPVVVTMHYLKFTGGLRNVQLFKLGVIVVTTVFIKCLVNGYEYITSTLLMMVVPVVYYIILNGLNSRQSLKSLGTLALGSCLGILLSFFILCFQIASVHGHFLDGVHHIVYSFEMRTHADPQDFPSEYAPGLNASTAYIVAKYLDGTFFDANDYLSASPFIFLHSLKIRYSYLVLVFMTMSVVLYFRKNRYVTQTEERKPIALICATWFSILAPLSWFIIFKLHSAVHMHMNFIVWQMPFVFCGFAVCGLVVRSLARPIRLTKRST
jgi:hypothetical protein